jgi:hypothetical protein
MNNTYTLPSINIEEGSKKYDTSINIGGVSEKHNTSWGPARIITRSKSYENEFMRLEIKVDRIEQMTKAYRELLNLLENSGTSHSENDSVVCSGETTPHRDEKTADVVLE